MSIEVNLLDLHNIFSFPSDADCLLNIFLLMLVEQICPGLCYDSWMFIDFVGLVVVKVFWSSILAPSVHKQLNLIHRIIHIMS